MDENAGKLESGILVPPWRGPEPYFQFIPKESRNVFAAHYEPSRVIDDKRYSCSASVSSLNALNRIYPNAIEVTSPTSQVVRGGEFFVGLFTSAFSIFALYFLTKVIRDSSSIALMVIPFLAFYIFAVASC